MGNTKEENELITMGMNLGLYIFAKLFAEEAKLSQKGWAILRDYTAQLLEEQTGMPAEDLALMSQPTVEDMLKRIPN